MSLKIGVFPASGALGTSIVKNLTTLGPASQLVLIARHPEKLAEFSKNGATVRQANYDDDSSLDSAFDGIDVLMLVSYASFEIEHRVKVSSDKEDTFKIPFQAKILIKKQVHRRAIDAAIASGAKHLFYSSLGFAGNLTDHSVAHVMGAHLATEKYLAEHSSQLTYTSVREGLYSESFPIYTAWFDPKNPVDEITIPHSGSGPGVAWVNQEDLGEATAKLIASYVKDPQNFKSINEKVLLSGQKEYSLAESVEIIGRAIGKPLKIREISVDEYVKLPQIGDLHTYHGVDLSREWSTAWEAIRNGETAAISPLIVELLGRQPESYEETIMRLVS